MSIVGAFGWGEYGDSPSFEFDDGRWTIKQHGHIDWAQINNFLLLVLPPSTTFGQRAGQVSGLPFPGNDSFTAYKVTIDPFPRSNLKSVDVFGLASYDHAEVTIWYRVTPYEETPSADPVQFLQHEWAGGGDFQTVKGRSMFWKSDGVPVDPDMFGAIAVPTIEHNITWPRVDSPPFDTIRSCMGSVNQNPLQFVTGTIAPETGLFLGANLSREFMTDGSRGWRVGYKWSERAVDVLDANDGGVLNDPNTGGWNHYFRDTSGKSGFYRVRLNGPNGSTDPYTKNDHSGLFNTD